MYLGLLFNVMEMMVPAGAVQWIERRPVNLTQWRWVFPTIVYSSNIHYKQLWRLVLNSLTYLSWEGFFLYLGMCKLYKVGSVIVGVYLAWWPLTWRDRYFTCFKLMEASLHSHGLYLFVHSTSPLILCHSRKVYWKIKLMDVTSGRHDFVYKTPASE